MDKYVVFLNDSAKIPFRFNVKQDSSKALEWRDITGPKKNRLFISIKIPELFPEVPKNETIQILWESFYQLYKRMISNDPGILSFKNDAQAWVKTYLTVYQTRNITPYIHAFAMHVSEFLTLYGSLGPFSRQGLEKLNDVSTIHYMRATNHHHKDDQALRQLLRKRNRIEAMEMIDGVVRPKRKNKCRSCGNPGHNKRSCTE